MFDKIFPPKKITLANGKSVLEKRSRTPFVVLLLLAAAYFSLNITGFDSGIIIRRIHQFFVILNEMVPPNWEYLSRLWSPLMDTIKMSLLGSILGALAALPVAILASSNIMKSTFIVMIFKFILSLLRTLPTLIAALIATFIFGLGTLAGTAAIFIFTLAYVGKLLYEQIENVDMSAYEAMESMGLIKTVCLSLRYIPASTAKLFICLFILL